MKLLFVMLIALLSGCAQLMNGQTQPVVLKKQNVYYTTCSGAVENMADCNRKAMNTCANGYNILDKFQDAQGAIRSLTFECKK
jgi:uncharacterized protein YceK